MTATERAMCTEAEDRVRELEAEVARLEAHNDEVRGERDRASVMLRDSEMQLRRAQGARDAARKNSRESGAAKARARADHFEDALTEIRDACEPEDPIFTTAAAALALGTGEEGRTDV